MILGMKLNSLRPGSTSCSPVALTGASLPCILCASLALAAAVLESCPIYHAATCNDGHWLIARLSHRVLL